MVYIYKPLSLRIRWPDTQESALIHPLTLASLKCGITTRQIPSIREKAMNRNTTKKLTLA